MKKTGLALLVFFLPLLLQARIIVLPDSFDSISTALSNAGENDTLLLRDGVYEETIHIRKSVTIASFYLTNNDTDHKNSTIIDAGGEPSVIQISGDCRAIISGLTLRGGNRSQGGGIYIRRSASPEIRHCIISENRSGIYCYESSSPLIYHCNIENNSSEVTGGEGIYCRDNSHPVITNCVIENNSGYGILCREGSNPTISDCYVNDNQSTGIYIDESSPTIRGCDINSNSDQSVGGIHCQFADTVSIENCSITYNHGGSYGGIGCYGSNLRIENCEINGNRSGSVGGIRLALQSVAHISDSQIIGNTSEGYWGAVRCDESVVNFNLCSISENASERGCAGISANNSSLNLERCVIHDHYSSDTGGAIHSISSSNRINHCTLVRNYSDVSGGSVSAEGDCNIQIVNSILWQNSFPQVHLFSWGNQDDETVTFNIEYTNLQHGLRAIETRGNVNFSHGKSIVDMNPEFINFRDSDFHLEHNSPCIDRGNPEMRVDPDQTLPDLGAFFRPQPNIQLQPTDVIFEDVDAGTTDSATVYIRNIGLEPLLVDTVYLAANRNYYAFETAQTPFTISPSRAQQVKLTFSPRSTGHHNAVLVVHSNDRDTKRSFIFIRGEGLDVPQNEEIPNRFAILDIYPNPFNANVTIDFYLPVPDNVKLRVYNQLGRILLERPGSYNTGKHSINLNLSQFATSDYFVELASTRHIDRMQIFMIK